MLKRRIVKSPLQRTIQNAKRTSETRDMISSLSGIVLVIMLEGGQGESPSSCAAKNPWRIHRKTNSIVDPEAAVQGI